MIGPLLQTAAAMATYAVSSAMVRRGAYVFSRRMMAAAEKFATKALANPEGFIREAGHFLDKTFNFSGRYPTSINVTQWARRGERIVEEYRPTTVSAAKKFVHELSEGVNQGLKARFHPYQVRMLKQLGKQVGMELTFLPANYIMYRYEKHRAVTEAQREETSSFARWYFKGGAFAVSIGSGFALERLNRGVVRRTGMRVIKALPAHMRRRVFDVVAGKTQGSLVWTGKALLERSLALLEARRTVTEGRGILSMLSRGVRPGDLLRSISKEGERIYQKQFGPQRVTAASRLSTDIQQFIEATDPLRKGKRERSGTMAVKAQIQKSLLDYKQAVPRYGGSLRSWNKLMRFMDYGTGTTEWRQRYRMQYATREVSFTVGDQTIYDIIPEDPSIRTVGGTRVDFGIFSASRVRDLALRAATRSFPGFVVDLFSLRHVLEAKSSEHALRMTTQHGGRGAVYLPLGYGEGTSDPRRVAQQMFGLPPDAYGIEAFVRSRTKLYANRGTLKRLSASEAQQFLNEHGEQLFMASAAHGELLLGANDFLVRSPGGGLHLLTPLRGKSGRPFVGRYQLGAIGEGKYLTFSRITSESKDIVTKIQRGFLGSEDVVFGEHRVNVGPTQVGAVRTDDENEKLFAVGLAGTVRKLSRWLELGESEERGIAGALKSIFTKYKDPRFLPTLLSKEYIQNPVFIDNIISTRKGIYDFYKLIKEETGEAATESWMRLVRRYGTEKLVRELRTQLPKTGFIAPSMNAKEAAEHLSKLLGYRRGLSGVMPEAFASLRRISGKLEAQPHMSVAEVLGETVTGKRKRFGFTSFNLSILDEVNATALQIELMGGGRAELDVLARYAKDPTEHSALAATAALGKVTKNVWNELRNSLLSDDSTVFEGTRNAVKTTIGMLSGPNSKMRDEILEYYSRTKPLHPILPFAKDTRVKVDSPEYQEVLAITDGRGLPFTQLIARRRSEYGMRPVGVLDTPNIMTMTFLRAFNRAASELLGIGINEAKAPTPGEFITKLVSRRVVPTLGALIGYSVLDRFADRFFEGTPFGEGLTTFGLNVYAGLKVAAFNILDFTGISDMSAYLEDLMPGVISSPLSGAVRGLGPVALGMWYGARSLGPRGGLMGGMIGSAIGMLLGGLPLGIFGDWDISKSREKIIQELQGKELVPIRKGRFWELSASPFIGGRTQYYRPHLYALLRSRYKQSPEFKDSIFAEIAGALAPDYYAMKDYYSRPYPVTAGLLGGVPLIGPALRAIPFVGRLLGGGFPIHEGESSPLYFSRVAKEFGGVTDTGMIAEQLTNHTGMFEKTAGGGFTYTPDYPNVAERPMSASDAVFGIGESISQLQDIVGLRGFMIGSLYEEMTGRRTLLDYAPQLADPSDIGGLRRNYWDYEFGGLLGASEVIRRYIPHRRNEIQLFNPIRNTMPRWLPGKDYMLDFQHGDPFTVIPVGEARLPGVGYEKLHDVSLTFPLLGDVIGEEIDSQVAFLLGYPEYMSTRNRLEDIARSVAEDIANQARKAGDLVREATTVYNPTYDIAAQADMILKDMRGEKVPVRVVPKGFAGQSSLNAFLVLSDAKRGILVEVDPETYEITETMLRQDIRQFQIDLVRGQKAQAAAMAQLKRMDRNKRPHNLANAYSWLDRYRILSDVAPYSKETRIAESIVQQQLIAGMYSPNQVAEVAQIAERKRAVIEGEMPEEYRFLNLGQHVHPRARIRDAYIEDEYNVLERTVGALWERMTHLRNPLFTKALNYRSALETYQANYIYGKQMQLWENPIQDYLQTYVQRMLGETDPIQGAISGVMAGGALSLIPGSLGFVAPVFPLAALGASLGFINSTSDTPYIPERVQETREFRRQYDAHLYVRNLMLYNKTGDPQYLKDANATMTSSLLSGRVPVDMTVRRYFGTEEAKLLEKITENVTRSEMDRVSKLLPKEYLPVFYRELQGEGEHPSTIIRELQAEEIPLAPAESPIYEEGVAPESVAIQTMEMRGLNAHDVGLGWYTQQARIERERMRGFTVTPSTAIPSNSGVTTLHKYLADPTTLRESVSAKVSRMIDLPEIIGRIIQPIGGVITRVSDDSFNLINIEVTLI